MGAHFGLAGFAPKSPLDYNDLRSVSATTFPTLQEAELGDICFQQTTNGLKAYRFVEVDAASAAVADGTVLVWKDVTLQTVTTVLAGARNRPAGVGQATISVSQRGWIQIGGYHAAIKTDGDDDIAADDNLITSDTVDGTCDSVAAGTASTYTRLGIAHAADSNANNTVAGVITLFGL